jgi:hypothetical protein
MVALRRIRMVVALVMMELMTISRLMMLTVEVKTIEILQVVTGQLKVMLAWWLKSRDSRTNQAKDSHDSGSRHICMEVCSALEGGMMNRLQRLHVALIAGLPNPQLLEK